MVETLRKNGRQVTVDERVARRLKDLGWEPAPSFDEIYPEYAGRMTPTGIAPAPAGRYIDPEGVLRIDPQIYGPVPTENTVWGRTPEYDLEASLKERFGGVSPFTTIPGVLAGDDQPFDWQQALMDAFNAGRGGGSAGPVYRPPDRRIIEDMVRDKQAVLVGKKDEARTQRLTDLYMKEDKLRWEKKTDNDPAQSVLEEIRKTAEYQRIHSLRPDTVDESEWLTSQIAGLRNLGVEDPDRAITQATVGTTAARAQEAGTIFQQQGQLKTTPAFFAKISRAVTDAARMVS